ncbi:signal peptidase II [Chromatiales bacterium (ex Bugula neritina AB1)]|nr:signal peptidase II [Chromatiales bacterium (ex Bugula neritina AB1)]
MKKIYLFIVLVIIAIDQITKWIANTSLELHEQNPVMPFFNWTLMYNYGAAFSFLSNAGGWQRWFFTIVATIISIVLVVWIYRLKHNEKWLGVALSLILGGAIGNLIDRVIFGYVIDFIQWYYERFYWPAFNIADASICVGTVILLATSFMADPNDSKVDNSNS